MYRSPLHILSELENDLSLLKDPTFLPRLRKKLLAEFNLVNSSSIEINGKQYTKDEVIKTIDTLMADPQMPMHAFVFANKDLLDFLENDFSEVKAETIINSAVPDELKKMLAAVLLERYSFFLKKALNARNFEKAKELTSIHEKLTEKEKDIFFDVLYKQLLQVTQQVQEVKKNNCTTILQNMEFLTRPSFAVFVNSLPSDFFAQVNKLVTAIINLMVAYQNVAGYQKTYLFDVSTVLCKINCEERLKKVILSNHEIISNLKENEGKRLKDPRLLRGGLALFMLILPILFVTLLIAILRDCTHNTDQTPMPVEEKKSPAYGVEFWLYRTTQLNEAMRKGQNDLPFVALKMDSSQSGKNPFRTILKREEETQKDTNLLNIIIENQTGYDLILFTHRDQTAEAFYFFRNHPDTLFCDERDEISLYFGNIPGYTQVAPPFDTSSNKNFEVYFKEIDQKAPPIFEKNYKIEIRKNESAEKIPVLRFTDDFLTKERFDNSEVMLNKIEGK